MNRQAPYGGSQRQYVSADKMQPSTGVQAFQAQPDTFASEQGHLYAPSRMDGQRNWHRNQLNLTPSPHAEVQSNASRSFEQSNIDPRFQSQSLEQDMDIGYEDKPSTLSYEDLERGFREETMKLVKEQNDIEDAENTRHKERLMEINRQYEDKLGSLRAQHASQREEFLRKESQARSLQYQESKINHHYTKTDIDDRARGYNGASAPTEASRQQTYVSGGFDSYRERQQPYGRGRETEARVPYPQGRLYNNISGTRFY